MFNQLHDQFHIYLVEHNPELILILPQKVTVAQYINEKLEGIKDHIDTLLQANTPQYQIIESCMELLTAELRPSRYLYLKTVLEEEFEGDYLQMREAETLTYELVNLITACAPIFKSLTFREENQDDRITRYAIIGQIKEYLEATKL